MLLRSTTAGILAGLTLGAATASHAALVAGDIAIVGFIDNGTPDQFSFVTLAPIAAGEVIYFTDNGWTGSQHRGASATDGDGNENLIKFTANSALPAGCFINSLEVSDPDFTWTKSGSIPGATSGTFQDISLAQGGDQIYAFQGPNSLPLLNVTNHVFVLDDTNGFENATDSATGNVPSGLTAGSTALTFNLASANTIRFDPSLAGISSGTKAQWLTEIADVTNWVTSGALPTTATSKLVIPEPGSLALAAAGLALLARRRRTA